MSPNSQMKVLNKTHRISVIEAIKLLNSKSEAIHEKRLIKANSEVQCLMSQECNEILREIR